MLMSFLDIVGHTVIGIAVGGIIYSLVELYLLFIGLNKLEKKLKEESKHGAGDNQTSDSQR